MENPEPQRKTGASNIWASWSEFAEHYHERMADFKSACAWVVADDDSDQELRAYSFILCCEAVSLEPENVRNVIKAAVADQNPETSTRLLALIRHLRASLTDSAYDVNNGVLIQAIRNRHARAVTVSYV